MKYIPYTIGGAWFSGWCGAYCIGAGYLTLNLGCLALFLIFALLTHRIFN